MHCNWWIDFKEIYLWNFDYYFDLLSIQIFHLLVFTARFFFLWLYVLLCFQFVFPRRFLFCFLLFFFSLSLPVKQLIIFHTRFFLFILFFFHIFSCAFFFILLSIYADTIHNVDRREMGVGRKKNQFQYSLLITRLFNNNKTTITATTTTKGDTPCCCILLFA